MIDDPRWPSPVRGNGKGVPWLNRLLEASKSSAIREIKVVNGTGKIQGNSAIISVNTSSTVTEFVFPFNIYPVTNKTATDAQKKIFTDLHLDINDFTFQISSGVVGARSYINNPVGAQLLNLFFTFEAIGNFEQQLFCPCTDNNDLPFEYPPSSPKPNTGTCVILDDTTPTLIFGIPAGSPINTAPIAYNQIVLNQINGERTIPPIPSNANWYAAFWLEIIDDPLNGIYVNLMGQMFGDFPRGKQVFPSGPNIITLGMGLRGFDILTEQLETSVLQMQDGNAINRWTPNSNTFRGAWTELFAALPAGKDHIVVYPGDIVIDDTVTTGFASGSGVTSGNFYTVYGNIDTATSFVPVAANPQSEPTHWAALGMAPAP